MHLLLLGLHNHLNLFHDHQFYYAQNHLPTVRLGLSVVVRLPGYAIEVREGFNDGIQAVHLTAYRWLSTGLHGSFAILSPVCTPDNLDSRYITFVLRACLT